MTESREPDVQWNICEARPHGLLHRAVRETARQTHAPAQVQDGENPGRRDRSRETPDDLRALQGPSPSAPYNVPRLRRHEEASETRLESAKIPRGYPMRLAPRSQAEVPASSQSAASVWRAQCRLLCPRPRE